MYSFCAETRKFWHVCAIWNPSPWLSKNPDFSPNLPRLERAELWRLKIVSVCRIYIGKLRRKCIISATETCWNMQHFMKVTETADTIEFVHLECVKFPQLNRENKIIWIDLLPGKLAHFFLHRQHCIASSVVGYLKYRKVSYASFDVPEKIYGFVMGLSSLLLVLCPSSYMQFSSSTCI